MRSKQLEDDTSRRTFVVVCDIGDDPMQHLQEFARHQALQSAHFTGVGAFSDVTLLYWNWDTREYEENRVSEQVEVAGIAGNITKLGTGEYKVHAHVVLGRRDGSALAGHLRHATVRPTLELFVREHGELYREREETSGLDLIRFGDPAAS